MPYVGNGNLELDMLTPGSNRPIGLANSNFAKIDTIQPVAWKFTASEPFSVGDYLAPDPQSLAIAKVVKADGTGTHVNYTFNCIGKALTAATAAGDVVRVFMFGITTQGNISGSPTPGQLAYLSSTVRGQIVTTAPANPKIVGEFLAGGTIWLKPTRYAAW